MEARLILSHIYKPLYENKTRYFILTSGRGAGKSFHIADFLLKLTYEAGHTILYTRYTMVSAHISIIPEFTHKIEAYGLGHVFMVTNNEIINTLTGSNILFRGIKTGSLNNTAALKSIANVTTVVFEEMEDLTDEDVFDTIDLSVRHQTLQNRIIAIMNPSFKKHFAFRRFFKTPNVEPTFCGVHDGVTYIYSSYIDNAKNLPQSFLEQAEKLKNINPLRFRHLFLGEWLEESEGLLWTKSMIERQRVDQAPDFDRVVVAIDPATTATLASDETGIIVVGRKGDHGYVLEDLSGKYSPNQWATVAVNAARARGASIVAEKNQGGDMVEAVIRQVDKTIRVKLVTATKGKAVRAEPIYGLYEQGKVWHVGQLPILELQMVTFNPDSTDSPDRVDALVWGLSDLMLKGQREWFVI